MASYFLFVKWIQLEKAFCRALYFSFAKRRLLLTFPALLLCGVFVVFCRALGDLASPWVSLFCRFLPWFLSFGVMLALGVMLAKLYPRDIRGTKINLRRFIGSLMDLVIGVSYIAIPPLLIYLLLFVLLGVFFLLKEIPGIGAFFSVVFAFVPFVLIFAILLLCFLSLGVLFFVTPSVNLLSVRKGSWMKRLAFFLKDRIFPALCLFAIGLVPLVFSFILLSFALCASFSSYGSSLAVALEMFFIMIPFAAFLSPAILFFFNFSSESYALLQEK